MTRRTMFVSALGLVAGMATVVGAVALAKPESQRADCPGKIVCPLTGELVCKDQCPVGADENEPVRACCSAESAGE